MSTPLLRGSKRLHCQSEYKYKHSLLCQQMIRYKTLGDFWAISWVSGIQGRACFILHNDVRLSRARGTMTTFIRCSIELFTIIIYIS